jgi:hypothetical protein
MIRRVALLATLLAILATGPGGAEPQTFRLRPVVLMGQAAPGGGRFEHVSVEAQPVLAPVNGRGQVAFFATLLRGTGGEGLFVTAGNRIRKIAVEGDPAPAGGTLSGFAKHPVPAINDTGTVAFAAAVTGGRTVEGVFIATGGGLQAIALAGEAAPGVPAGTLAAVDVPTLSNRGDVAFLATVRRGRDSLEAIYLRTGGRLRKVVLQGDPTPAGGTFGAFGVPALNDRGEVAFAAVVEGRGVPGGLFIGNGGTLRMVVGAGDATPLGGIFAKFSERIALDATGSLAFIATLKDASVSSGVFAAERGRLRSVAALGDPAPGGGVFAHFGLSPAVGAAGSIVFTAAVDRGATTVAVFVAGPEGLRRVAGVGDNLPGVGPLASFGLYPIAAMAAGRITFATATTATGEGVEGIFLAEPVGPP